MKLQTETYGKFIQSSIAAVLLVLFTSCFIVEAVMYDISSLYKSELVDFEGDHDSEEDTEKENKKEKEDQLMCDFHLLISDIIQVSYLGHEVQNNPNTAIQEVISPPPELT